MEQTKCQSAVSKSKSSIVHAPVPISKAIYYSNAELQSPFDPTLNNYANPIPLANDSSVFLYIAWLSPPSHYKHHNIYSKAHRGQQGSEKSDIGECGVFTGRR
ncbi:hypothetical protein BofuT4_P066080.1 [Botrytis cinerea T4]|uniref:Uncharacterized protein n=1 Tax=Botryotinia fuckeliana (strain T4) TaxID=999810 RepID=G2XRT3_BOTF4|nr:hypothetical protein BofuT4_P066080.1 [Botrytis cinerea T4]